MSAIFRRSKKSNTCTTNKLQALSFEPSFAVNNFLPAYYLHEGALEGSCLLVWQAREGSAGSEPDLPESYGVIIFLNEFAMQSPGQYDFLLGRLPGALLRSNQTGNQTDQFPPFLLTLSLPFESTHRRAIELHLAGQRKINTHQRPERELICTIPGAD